MNNDDKIVYIKLDTWNDMKDAAKYLEELEDGKHDNEVNYCEVWYDMAIIYCITTTEFYVEKYPELKQHILNDTYRSTTIFAPYFPEYDPNNFGVKYRGEFEGWAPYKDFNRQITEHFQKQNKQNNEQHCNNNTKENQMGR